MSTSEEKTTSMEAIIKLLEPGNTFKEMESTCSGQMPTHTMPTEETIVNPIQGISFKNVDLPMDMVMEFLINQRLQFTKLLSLAMNLFDSQFTNPSGKNQNAGQNFHYSEKADLADIKETDLADIKEIDVADIEKAGLVFSEKSLDSKST